MRQSWNEAVKGAAGKQDQDIATRRENPMKYIYSSPSKGRLLCEGLRLRADEHVYPTGKKTYSLEIN